jgi:hypothetical protein
LAEIETMAPERLQTVARTAARIMTDQQQHFTRLDQGQVTAVECGILSFEMVFRTC